MFVLSFNRLYSVILLVDNTPIKYLFSLWSFLLGVGIFSNCKTEKETPVQGKEIIVFLVSALRQSQKFSVAEKFLKWIPALNLDKETMKRNSGLNTVMFNHYFLIL